MSLQITYLMLEKVPRSLCSQKCCLIWSCVSTYSPLQNLGHERVMNLLAGYWQLRLDIVELGASLQRSNDSVNIKQH